MQHVSAATSLEQCVTYRADKTDVAEVQTHSLTAYRGHLGWSQRPTKALRQPPRPGRPCFQGRSSRKPSAGSGNGHRESTENRQLSIILQVKCGARGERKSRGQRLKDAITFPPAGHDGSYRTGQPVHHEGAPPSLLSLLGLSRSNPSGAVPAGVRVTGTPVCQQLCCARAVHPERS